MYKKFVNYLKDEEGQTSTEYILLIAVVAGIFGILLLVSPNTILIMERQANKIYMTDTFFFENRIVIGIALLLSSGFMIKTYLSFS